MDWPEQWLHDSYHWVSVQGFDSSLVHVSRIFFVFAIVYLCGFVYKRTCTFLLLRTILVRHGWCVYVCVCVCAVACVWRGLKKNGSVRWWTLIRMLCRCMIIGPYVQRGGGGSVHLQVAEFEFALTIQQHRTKEEFNDFLGSEWALKHPIRWQKGRKKLRLAKALCPSLLSSSDPKVTVVLCDLWRVVSFTMMSLRALSRPSTADATRIQGKPSSKVPSHGLFLDQNLPFQIVVNSPSKISLFS